MREKRLSLNHRAVLFSLAFALVFLFSMISTFSYGALAVTEEQAMQNLTTYVYGKMSQTDYTLEKGGSVKGADLFEGKPTEGYDLIGDEFSRLSDKAQKQAVSDMFDYANDAVEDDSVKGVEESTVENWLKQLQTKEGVGSKFMIELTKNTKADFVTANRIWEPFAGPLGIFLGVLCVGIMIMIGISCALDICYMVIPMFRMLVSDDNSNNSKGLKPAASVVISHAAIMAVRTVEQDSTGENAHRQTLGIYLKYRIIMLVVLGICLLYLVSGNIYTFVGYILDLVSGFLGF